MSTTSISASPGGNLSYLDLLPEEVWLIIFGKLPPTALYSCYQTSSILRSWLAGQRLHFLSALVIPILEPYFTGKKGKADFLNWRRVSRLWKSSVDQHCQSLPFYEFHNSFSSSRELLAYNFYTSGDIADFMLAVMNMRRSNPFISRTVKFDDDHCRYYRDPELEAQQYWNDVTLFLRLHGRHVWYCGIHVYTPHDTSYMYKRIVHELITLMPNLRSLSLFKLTGLPSWGIREDPVNERRRINNLAREFPLPTLPKLARLECTWWPAVITEKLLHVCDPVQLEKLVILSDTNCTEYIARFENLTEFQTRLHSTIGTGGSALTPLASVTWPLAKVILTVTLCNDGLQGSVTFLKLFTWLSKFEESLITLNLILSGSDCYSGTNCGQLCLPRLKQLDIEAEGAVRVDSLDFAENLRSLEEFHLQVPEGFRKERNPAEIIRFQGRHLQLLYSNIWELCKKLKVVKLQDNKLSYEYHWKGCAEESDMDVISNPLSFVY